MQTRNFIWLLPFDFSTVVFNINSLFVFFDLDFLEGITTCIFLKCRADYSPKNDLLEDEFMLKGRWFHRKDLVVMLC